jgi:phage repressor protein C with HTH and peptisase S24 domain
MSAAESEAAETAGKRTYAALTAGPRPTAAVPGAGGGTAACSSTSGRVAEVLKVERRWLLHGLGEVEGEVPLLDDPDEGLVAIPSVSVTASMGGGSVVEDELEGRRYHFQRSWIRHKLRSQPTDLRIMHVEGDSMMPTLHHDDVVLVDLSRGVPTQPSIFVLYDGMGLVAKRLEHIPNSDPPRVRIISDNAFYAPYDCTAEEVSIIGRIRWYAREI